MKLIRMVGAVVAFGLGCSALPIVTPQGAGFSGYVYEAGTSTPIADSEVRLTSFSGRRRTTQPQLSEVTDRQGYFEFRKVPPGSYLIEASKDGYVHQIFGKPTPGKLFDPDAIMDLTDDQQKSGLIIHLTPAGEIAGRIVSDRGGVRSVQVAVLHREYDVWGRLTYVIVGSAVTDANGRYSISGLIPGEHYVGAGTSSALLGGGTEFREFFETSNLGQVPDRQYSWRYYPNADDIGSATRLTIRAHEKQELKDLALEAETLQRSIRVRLIDDATGQPPPQRGSNLGIIRKGAPFAESSAWLPIFQPNGEFQTRGVAPGVYWVSAYWYIPGGPSTTASGWSLDVADVTEKDADVELRLIDEITISGKVTVEASQSSSKTNLEGIVISFLFPNAADTRVTMDQNPSRLTNRNGEFSFKGILPGDYRIRVDAIPTSLYLKDLRLRDESILNQPILVRGKVNDPLSIVLGSNAGRIDGIVMQADEKPGVRNKVVIVPDNQRDRSDLFQVTESTSAGAFRLVGLAPGDYKLFAWKNIERYSWFDPEVLRRNDSQGVRIHISEGSLLNVQLQSITD